MLDGRKVLAVIAARGGSKGLPRKNVLPVGGKPLIAWTIEAALASRRIDRTILSTDDDEIALVASRFGCEVPFRRPAALASDDAASIDVVLHAVDEVGEGFDWLVLLQPTSPLRQAADIDAAVDMCQGTSAPACVGVTQLEEPLAWVYGRDRDGELTALGLEEAVVRRQDAAQHVRLNGAVYVANVDALRRFRRFVMPGTRGYLMPRDRSVDIDDHTDLMIADALLRRGPC
jgi:N-acylneuraminate cytidylyltransferase